MTSIFEGQPPKTRPFPIKTRVIWVPGIYIFVWRVQVTGLAYRIFIPVIGSNSNVIGFTRNFDGFKPLTFLHMGVEPKIGGVYPPKWMVVYNGKPNPIKRDDLGASIFGNTHITTVFFWVLPTKLKGAKGIRR